MTDRPPTIAKTSYRLTEESKYLLSEIAKATKRSRTKTLEVLIETEAKKLKIAYDPSSAKFKRANSP